MGKEYRCTYNAKMTIKKDDRDSLLHECNEMNNSGHDIVALFGLPWSYWYQRDTTGNYSWSLKFVDDDSDNTVFLNLNFCPFCGQDLEAERKLGKYT